MRAEQDEFVRLLATANFPDDVFGFRGTANVVRHIETGANFLSCGDESCDAFGVFARQNGLRQLLEFTVDGYIVAIQQEIGARGHPEYCGGASLHGAVNNFVVHIVFGDEVFPGDQQIRVNSDDRAAG